MKYEEWWSATYLDSLMLVLAYRMYSVYDEVKTQFRIIQK